jgi:hypothetical protein
MVQRYAEYSVGSNYIALDQLVKLGPMLYELKEQSIKKVFIGDFPFITPNK